MNRIARIEQQFADAPETIDVAELVALVQDVGYALRVANVRQIEALGSSIDTYMGRNGIEGKYFELMQELLGRE